jgi:O-acetyl-ADP-ribose deacetylase (regulator of RNase III)
MRPAYAGTVRIGVVQGDITEMKVDVIVNAANSSLLGGGGVDGAIHFSGGPDILAACRALRQSTLPAGLPPGQAVATTAGRLPARWVVHTVGPVYTTREDRRPTLLQAYASCLRVCDELGARSVAFPLLSAGAYGWPLDDAADAAVEAMKGATTDVENVRLVAFSSRVRVALEGALRAL